MVGGLDPDRNPSYDRVGPPITTCEKQWPIGSYHANKRKFLDVGIERSYFFSQMNV